MSRVAKRRFCICLALFLCSCLIYVALTKTFLNFVPFPHMSFMRGGNRTDKVILTWTPFFGQPMGNDYLNGCPFRNSCFITWDRSYYESADAFVFHATDMDLRNLPPKRTPAQLYVLLSHESPPHTDRKAYEIGNFFNWTMTYRMDSDVPYPYSYIVKTETPSTPTVDLNASILNPKKTKLVAWFASNCYTPSKREQYVDSLKSYISVDVYGQCGNLVCPRTNQSACDRLLNEEYKFYIAFENSLCLDYATEKFYARAYLNAVPIVLKRSDVEKLFPKGSFVAADDFTHPKFLAAYLKYLDSNDTAYLKYFRWRNEGYTFQNHDERGNYFGFCGLCQKLLKGSFGHKSYPELKKWWLDGGKCDEELVPRLLSLKDV